MINRKEFVKRCFIKKFVYILVSLFLMFLLNLLNINIVRADTVNFTNARMDIEQCEVVQCPSGQGYCYGNCIWDSGNAPGDTVYFGANNGYMNKIQFIARTNSGVWDSGNYHISLVYYTSPFDLSHYSSKYDLKFYASPNYNTSSYVEGISNYISFYQCNFTLRGSNGLDIVCDFGVTQPIKNIMIEFSRKDRVYGLYNSESAYFGDITQFTMSSDTSGAINSQTTVIQNNFNETNENINSINDSINDDTVDDPSSAFEDMEEYLPENGVISSLIALPITLYSKVLNSINGTCQSFSLGSLYNTNLIIPCIDIDDYLGSTLWNLIDILISGFFILAISRKFIKAFNNFTSLKEGDVIGD